MRPPSYSERATSPRPKDMQKRKVYAAEREVFAYDTSKERPLPIERCEAKVLSILKSEFVLKAWPKVSAYSDPDVVEKASGYARGGTYSVKLPPWARMPSNFWIIVHETSHVIASRQYGFRAVAGHGREFCLIYLSLVRYFIGGKEADLLEAAFKRHGVKYRAKRKLSIEQTKALQERGRALAAHRKRLATV